MSLLKKSSFIDVADFAPSIEDHIDDVLLQRVHASSVSDSTIRFRVLSNGPRALLDSEVLLVCKLKISPGCSEAAEWIDLKRDGAFGASGGMVDRLNAIRLETTPPARGTLHDGSLELGAFDSDTTNTADGDAGDAAIAKAYNSGLVPATNKCLAFAERFSGFWRACSSVVLEINGSTSVQMRPDEILDLTDMLLIPDQERKAESCSWPSGPPDSLSGGQAVAKAFHIDAIGSPGRKARFEEMEIDRGFAERCKIFQKRHGGADDAQTYTLVTRMLPLGPFSYYRNGMGSNRRGMIPYISSLNVLINLKPNPFMHMFQCSAVQGTNSSGGWTVKPRNHCVEAAQTRNANVARMDALIAHQETEVRYPKMAYPAFTAVSSRKQVPGHNGGLGVAKVAFDGSPFLICKWVAPSSKYQFAPTYTFENTRYVVYRKTSTLLNSAKTALQDTEIRFDQIKCEALPKMWILNCRPVAYTSATAPQYREYRAGHFDCSYAESFDRLVEVDEGYGTSLQITCNERSGLMLSYTLRELYAITKRLCPSYPFSYETWRDDKQIIVLSPAMVPTPAKSSVYTPTTFSIKGTWQRNPKHWVTAASPAVVNQQHEVRLVWVYNDSITLSSSSASSQAFLVSAAAADGKPANEFESAADGLARET